MDETVSKSLAAARGALDALVADADLVGRIAGAGTLIAERLGKGAKVMICGNGGSACDAAHFAEEMTGRFRKERPPLPAIACTDAGHITCTANDYGFEEVFSRWVEALGQQGDVLIVLSTSGNSENIVRAARVGRAKEMIVIGLLGRGGGEAAAVCDHPLDVPGETSDRIQELHMLILHAWVEVAEAAL
ncbi:MAG: SIS domain-containing protein [Phycisphaeraceae bacterium]|nr:SIS domain-containing protein [Phycisphaeraceae bacterium]